MPAGGYNWKRAGSKIFSTFALDNIPELISYREINEVLTQIIAVHSLFNSFQNTAINDTSPLLSSWRYGKFCGSCKQMRAI